MAALPRKEIAMTPWLRFWVPNADNLPASEAPPPDAAPWTRQAIADTQRELWRHAAQATHDWWAYWRAFWPALPAQPQAGVVQPPKPRPVDDEAKTATAAAAAEHRRSPTRPPHGRGRSSTASPRPRSGARGR